MLNIEKHLSVQLFSGFNGATRTFMSSYNRYVALLSVCFGCQKRFISPGNFECSFRHHKTQPANISARSAQNNPLYGIISMKKSSSNSNTSSSDLTSTSEALFASGMEQESQPRNFG